MIFLFFKIVLWMLIEYSNEVFYFIFEHYIKIRILSVNGTECLQYSREFSIGYFIQNRTIKLLFVQIVMGGNLFFFKNTVSR